jgi:hypothetical protein
MDPIRLLVLIVGVAAGLYLGPAPVLAHGGCPDAAAAAAIPLDAMAAPRPAQEAPVLRADPVPAAQAPALRSASTAQAPEMAPAHEPMNDCGHDLPAACGMMVCGAVCHAAMQTDVAVLPVPDRSVRRIRREVPDPAAHPAEVALPPPRARG